MNYIADVAVTHIKYDLDLTRRPRRHSNTTQSGTQRVLDSLILLTFSNCISILAVVCRSQLRNQV